jgi:hypothetical protein
MAEEHARSSRPRHDRGPTADVRMAGGNRRLDALAFGVISLVIALLWLPTLTSGRRVSLNDDFFMHAARHEAVRKSVIEHRTFPLRSHWFGGGFPTLGEPEDPALNPLVLLSLVFGSAMGVKLVGFAAVLVSGVGTYALARYILEYTRWGALFSALMVATSLFVPGSIRGGNVGEVCAAYLPLCMLLIALSCRGRKVALLLLPVVLYTMLSQGKQGFFTAILYLGVLCLLDGSGMLRTLTPAALAGKFDVRALKVLLLALGVTSFVGMVRVLPMLEFLSTKGGLTHMELYPYISRITGFGPTWRELVAMTCGLYGHTGLVTIGWLPVVLFGIASCWFWKKSLPWIITLVLFGWLALANEAPLNLFGLLKRLPVFSAMAVP